MLLTRKSIGACHGTGMYQQYARRAERVGSRTCAKYICPKYRNSSMLISWSSMLIGTSSLLLHSQLSGALSQSDGPWVMAPQSQVTGLV
jgi:hypothetical protein